MHCIEFKTKPFPVIQSDGSERVAITLKVKLGRSDCNLRAHEHTYYNSDLFSAMLNRAYRAKVGASKQHLYLDALPEGVTVDTSKFLAVVKVELPQNFR